MKAVIQRVINASVAVDGQTISSIGKGLLVLIGIDKHDEPSDSTTIIKKILQAKLFDDETGTWKKDVRDIDGEVLCVSQFTLLATLQGTKPDFHESMVCRPIPLETHPFERHLYLMIHNKAFYEKFLEEIRATYSPDKIKDGEFGAMMQVSLCNDGPVTLLLSSRDRPAKSTDSKGEEARAKQKEMAEAKARKREEFEAKSREKERLKKEKDAEWKKRNGVDEGGVLKL